MKIHIRTGKIPVLTSMEIWDLGFETVESPIGLLIEAKNEYISIELYLDKEEIAKLKNALNMIDVSDYRRKKNESLIVRIIKALLKR